MAATASGSEIQLTQRPAGPRRPPRPSLNRGSWRRRNGPSADSTTPVRSSTVRTGACGRAAASHSWHNPARNPCPGPVRSETTVSPRSL